MTTQIGYKSNQNTVLDHHSMSSRRIVGYYANWSIYGRNFPVSKIQAANYTHVLYCFYGISSTNNQLISLDPWADFHADNGDNSITDARKPSDGPGCMNDLYRLKKSNPGLKIGISAGGAASSWQFTTMVSTQANRAAFIQSVTSLTANFGLDFIDIDWEYPASAQDGQNFVSLLSEMYHAFQQRSLKTEISIAIGASQEALQYVYVKSMLQYVGFFNLMAYPYGGFFLNTVEHIAPLLLPASMCVTSGVNLAMSTGIPASKVVLGIPAYCYAYANCTQLGTPNRGSASIGDGGILDLNLLYKQNMTFHTSYDAKAGGAYSVCNEKSILVTHESDDTMKQKCQFIESKQLGGAMLWHIASDWQDNTSLAKVAADRWLRKAN